MLVEKVVPDLELEVLGKSQRTQVTIESSCFLLILFVSFGSKTEQGTDDIDKIAEGHAAKHLDNGDEESFEIICIGEDVLLGEISPNPTVESMVAPQYQPTM